MKHPDTDTDIKCRPDGSIDTAYYMQIGRQKRAEQAQEMIRGLAPGQKSTQP
jgi:hypothetical protein